MTKEKSFAQELAELINRHGIDNDLNTPDWVFWQICWLAR